MTQPDGGWRTWLLSIAGALIVLLVSVLLALIGRGYDHIMQDHRDIFERILKLEQAALKKE
jgi:hypothetical protein